MRRIAIIGSGIIGLIAAHALRKARYDVTLYSDRTADQWLRESRPTGPSAKPTSYATLKLSCVMSANRTSNAAILARI